MSSPSFPPAAVGTSFPSTQSLPDLSLTHSLTHSDSSSPSLSPSLRPLELAAEGNDLLDDENIHLTSSPPPQLRTRSYSNTHSTQNGLQDTTPRKMNYNRSSSSNFSSSSSRTPLLVTQDSFSRSHHHHRHSSSSSSSVSSLGSIHSAPELLLPLTPSSQIPPSPPPELVRKQSSFETRRKRESIAVMEQSHRRGESQVSQEGEGMLESPLEEEERFMNEEEEEEESPDEARREGGKRRRKRRKREFPNTLWEYLKEEVCTVEIDGQEGIKSERVTNFLTVPKELEKIIFLGFIICLDAFLYTFTILPLRSLSALYSFLSLILYKIFHPRSVGKSLKLSHKTDLIKMVIVVITGLSLYRVTDASKMYHGVRGQETIKLYVLFNVLEIADRLCCSFGQDLSDSLFSSTTLSRSSSQSQTQRIPSSSRPIALFLLYTLYVISHSLVLFYQLVTLNVAVNSYSNALLTLLLSNQFVEIKGSVFKKFEKENLFQMTCADIVERFQLALMLFIISLRNLIELSSSSLPSSPSTSSSALSPYLPDPSLVLKTFSPALTVLISECFVDWLKHAFITKFNHIRPGVYGRYIDVLCKDLIKGQSGSETVDQSPSVSRRLGFAALPLSCLVIRVFSQAFEILGDESGMDECLMPFSSSSSSSSPFVVGHKRREGIEDVWEMVGKWAGVVGGVMLIWICLITLKLLIGINLRTFASERWGGLERVEREEEDWKNGRSRKGIGISLNETIEIEKTNKLLRDQKFDEPTKAGLAGGGGKKEIELENIGRYDMIRSRLW